MSDEIRPNYTLGWICPKCGKVLSPTAATCTCTSSYSTVISSPTTPVTVDMNAAFAHFLSRIKEMACTEMPEATYENGTYKLDATKLAKYFVYKYFWKLRAQLVNSQDGDIFTCMENAYKQFCLSLKDNDDE